MPNQITQAQAGDDRVKQWLHIDDFSPGIWDSSYISLASPTLTAPLGAASANETWKCASLPSGGLGPLPDIDYSDSLSFFPGATNIHYIVGFALNPGLGNGLEELIIILESDDGSTHYFDVWSRIPNSLDQVQIANNVSASTPGYFGSPYPEWTRISAQPVIGEPGYIVPEPRLVFPSAVITDPHGNQGHLWCYPPVSSPTSYSLQDLVNPGVSGVSGQVITYNSRVQVLAGVGYQWPIAGGISTNENINYTDPPQSQNFGSQQTILAAEQPWGYGAWGSVTVGELVLIKKSGGGVVMNGDISEPTSIISLPGIESTGDFVGKADASSIGLVYCSQNRGAWLWNGGNTSQKISSQIKDNFYDCSSTVIASNNYGFCAHHWQDWVLFSNNFMYNPDTGGWWRIHPTDDGNATTTGMTFWWWQQGRLGNHVYAAPLAIGSGAPSEEIWYVRFNNEVPSGHYSWLSLPVHVTANANRVVDVTQVIIRLSSPDNTGGTATVTINNESHTTQQVTAQVRPHRLNFGSASIGLVDIRPLITCDNDNGSAPLVHSIDIGFSTRALNPSDN